MGDGRWKRGVLVPQGRIVNVLGAKIEARLKKPLAFRSRQVQPQPLRPLDNASQPIATYEAASKVDQTYRPH
jgi:hypothetical protein